jgi:hypothetical protein
MATNKQYVDQVRKEHDVKIQEWQEKFKDELPCRIVKK